jgi:hypothetical protein
MAMVAAPATLTSHKVQEQERTEEPRLHAYPDGSDVSLCGLLRKQGVEQGNATRFCRTCEGLASSVNHRG